jgi:hypothetical protein
MIDNTTSGGKPWLLDKVYVIKAGAVFRAQPPTKVVNNGQTITWDAKVGKLELAPQPEFTNIIYGAGNTTVSATVNSSRPYFDYSMTCDGAPVEGNSPPNIVIET